jgi:hypothetical protein
VDGRVNESNAQVLVEAGANVLVAGSSIFGPDPHQAIQNLRNSAAAAAVTADVRMLRLSPISYDVGLATISMLRLNQFRSTLRSKCHCLYA